MSKAATVRLIEIAELLDVSSNAPISSPPRTTSPSRSPRTLEAGCGIGER